MYSPASLASDSLRSVKSDTIGNTPVIRINNLGPDHVTVYVKAEFFNPAASVKDCVHFTSDDDTWRVNGPGCIRAIVEKDWKYAVYYDPFAGAEPEYEMYDLKNDPFEVINLAHEENWDPKYADERRRLHRAGPLRRGHVRRLRHRRGRR